ncbi:hypothetical protein [Mycobacterium sp. BK086]|uniref:hypothetical protein n=1 Tax=Mycobacterium sp. BK086 TaxID=2512165 RepID=UPI00105EA0D8|nr:hypothetical protein [Mycobacterium sp. BK086]
MATDVVKCSTCGDGFLGTPRSKYCTPACKQKAHRRRGAKSNADRNVTVERATQAGHCAEALAVLSGLDQELASNASRLGKPLRWSTAEVAVRELIAEAIDRKVDLRRRYETSSDDKTALKFSAELRLVDASIARLLKQVKTDMPPVQSRKSAKAAAAASVRWENA